VNERILVLRRVIGVILLIASVVIIIRACVVGIETVNVYLVLALLCISGLMELSTRKGPM
jgi:hypothetical protein